MFERFISLRAASIAADLGSNWKLPWVGSMNIVSPKTAPKLAMPLGSLAPLLKKRLYSRMLPPYAPAAVMAAVELLSKMLSIPTKLIWPGEVP